MNGANPGQENKETAVSTSSQNAGLGAWLKAERERKGLNYEQVSEITKVRPYILEALESEVLVSLPPPVFLKGFVRSYARALGLDESEALALYEKLAPVENFTSKPILRASHFRRNGVVYGILFLVLFAVAGYGLRGFYFKGTSSKAPTTVVSPGEEGLEQAPLQPERSAISDLARSEEAMGPAVPVAGLNEKKVSRAESPDDSTLPELRGGTTLDRPKPPGAEPGKGKPEFLLRANVKEKTWLRILVDDQKPKEYLFRAGSHPEWKAKKGFEILIGNAAGVELEFNGNEIQHLGRSGQVVLLNFPEDYKRRGSQE